MGKEIGKVVSNKYTSQKNSETIETAIQKAVVKVRKILPKKIDDVTTLTNVEGSGSKIMFFYVLDRNNKDIDRELFHKAVSKKLSHDLCNEKGMLHNLKKGATYAYYYKDKKGSLIDTLEFNINACNTNKIS